MKNQWWMAYKITMEMLKRARATNRIGILMQIVDVFLQLVSIYECVDQNLQEQEAGKVQTRQKVDHLTAMSNMADEILSWLKFYASKWSYNMEESLNVNNLFLVLKLDKTNTLYWFLAKFYAP